MGKSESSRRSGERRSNREALREAKGMFPGGAQSWAQDLLRQKLDDLFQDVSPAPRLMKLELAMEIQPVNHLVIRCKATLDYGGVQAARVRESRISLNEIPADTVLRIRTERLRDILKQQLPGFFKTLTAGLPSRYSSSAPHDQLFAASFQQVTFDGFVLGRTGASFPQAVQHALSGRLQDLQERVWKTVRNALQARMEAPALQGPGLSLPVLTGLTLRAGGNQEGTLSLSASLALQYVSAIPCNLTVTSHHLSPQLRGTPPEETDSRIFQAAENLTDRLARAILDRLPAAEVLPPDTFPEGQNPVLPLPVHQTLLQGALSGVFLEYNPLFPDRKSDSPAFRRIFLRESGELELLSASKLGKEPEKILSLAIPAFRKALGMPFGLSQRYVMPQDPGGLCRFCQEADRLYQAQNWKQLPKPAIQLFFNARHEISHIRFHEKTVPAAGWKVKKGDHVNLRRRFLALLEQVRAAEQERWNLAEQQRAVLLSLSPAQLYIVRLLAPRNCSQTRIETKLRQGGFLRPAAAVPLLESLMKIMLPLENGSEPLVRTRVRPGDWKRYDVFYVNSKLQSGLLEQVPQKDWTDDELDLLTPAAAESWFLQQAARADTPEARWQVFSLLESRFSETFAVRFARSEAGQAFFGQVRGTDAAYMRLFLENLRGCHALAAQLLPEEPADAGEAPSS